MIFCLSSPTTGRRRLSSSTLRCTRSLVLATAKSAAARTAGIPSSRYHQRTNTSETRIMSSVSRGSFGTSCLKVAASCGTSTVISTKITPTTTTSTRVG
ncbi:hypothetical protein D3C83_68870 [compost metagenome]